MRKLVVIRGIATTIIAEGESAIERLIPAVQQALVDDARLDLHAEATSTFLSLIRNRELASAYP